MKIVKFNENIEISNIDSKEVCVNCGNIAVHLLDSSPLYIPEHFEPEGLNFDDEIYSETICDKCGHKDNIIATINWKPTKKQIEFADLIEKGMNPVEIKKYNL